MTETLFTISVSKTLARRVLTAAAVLTLVSQVGAQQPATISEASTNDEIQKFCTNIADAARDQRYLLQKQELEKLQADVDARIEALEQRTAEYQDWLKRRNDFLARAQAGLVDMFKTMKPDAAAPQLQEMRMEIAAAIIMQLPARQSALFLSEMDPEKAGMISTIISSATDPNTSKARPNTPKAPS
ncbi:flagellar motility protein MotE (MotC chaperone) [Neorhizobium sp. R1-B]|jgi:flagellar motility protein MotE (MotC chaperone)|uniref:MotE family protein n=1 Tax=Neorhizobium TaxID=1525371 RepID=UPI000CF9D73D|nr:MULTISPECIES: MotE family protein [Neorhizobium]TCV76072.1 flagellar motility protein MotE (MotC chaperone) [Neorhizobium sp. S3-V5DH]TDX88939.1 flagellar motility protein MotE (MotC chaperone) [Neorhizobium sp. R1-B]